MNPPFTAKYSVFVSWRTVRTPGPCAPGRHGGRPYLPLELLRPLERLLHVADHVERLLRQLVVLAVDDLAEPRDRLLQRHVLAGRARERLGHVERLREEL